MNTQPEPARPTAIDSCRYPFSLFIYLSGFCNYHCSYCFTNSGPQANNRSFVLSHWLGLVDQARRLGIPELRLSGGEPLLVKGIEAHCRQIVEREMTYTITSNGSNVERHLEWLSECPPETLWLSFHSEQTTREQFAERVALSALRLPRVGVNILARDLGSDSSILSLCAIAGATRFKILHLTPIGRQRHDDRAQPWSADDIRTVGESLRLAVGRPIEIRIEAPAVRGTEKGPSSCALRSRPLLSVGSDGRVYPCCVTVGIEGCEVGDLKVEPLRAIVARAAPATLPCRATLPEVAAGAAACPLSLFAVE
jgi:MoaA/NifB/PqqE/SkfB family radical SAM enzyme